MLKEHQNLPFTIAKHPTYTWQPYFSLVAPSMLNFNTLSKVGTQHNCFLALEGEQHKVASQLCITSSSLKFQLFSWRSPSQKHTNKKKRHRSSLKIPSFLSCQIDYTILNGVNHLKNAPHPKNGTILHSSTMPKTWESTKKYQTWIGSGTTEERNQNARISGQLSHLPFTKQAMSEISFEVMCCYNIYYV